MISIGFRSENKNLRLPTWEATRAWLVRHVWHADLRVATSRRGAAWMVVLGVAGLITELGIHQQFFRIGETLRATTVALFANVRELALSQLDASIAGWLVAVAVFRVLFGVVVAVLDMTLYRKITGRRFDWEGMVSLAGVNLIFLCTAMFTFMNPAFHAPLAWYERLLSRVPTLVDLNGSVAVLAACLLGDFCFYWSHRWCHKVRLFWNLGHINHHRAQEMSQLTHAVDPHALFLDTAGGKVFVLVLLPLVSKLFTLDLREGGWMLVALMVVDVWLNPSHSVALYFAEIRFAPLRWARWLLVTPGVHYTHHSREDRHNLSDGANFGARFTLWDRMFGTYVEPPPYIPETGLYGDQVDYCRNPVRFVLLPYAKLLAELRSSQLRHWPAILFGSTSWKPPPKPARRPMQGLDRITAQAAQP
jgi:sterol desaturase/sphingolipid hydroxylase (fatty acid hydroxylase superfamily)